MKTKIPNGVKDFLPEEANKRLSIAKKIIAIFEENGYQRIITPVLELYETLKLGLSPELEKNCIRFIDKDGQLAVLRPDMTTPIARLIASRLKEIKQPLKFYYFDKVFRKQKAEAGKEIEFYQIGIEFIGENSKQVDAEVLKLAKLALQASGLKDIEIDIGHVDELKSLSKVKKKALLDGNYVNFGSLPNKKNLLVKDFDYYTGLVFECYVPDIGYIIGSGGRYDKLLAKFGLDVPAIGFALNLEKIILALEKQDMR